MGTYARFIVLTAAKISTLTQTINSSTIFDGSLYRLPDGSVQQELKGDRSFPVQPYDVVLLLESMQEYMASLSISKELKSLCKVEHNMCAAWALNGGKYFCVGSSSGCFPTNLFSLSVATTPECERNPQCKTLFANMLAKKPISFSFILC